MLINTSQHILCLTGYLEALKPIYLMNDAMSRQQTERSYGEWLANVAGEFGFSDWPDRAQMHS